MLVFTLLGQLDTGKTGLRIFFFFVLILIYNSLKSLDIEMMKRLGSRVNLIPVIAKADTLTPSDLQKFKENVSQQTVLLYIN
jgi:septin family protein